MLVPVQWLKEFTSFDIPPEALAERLTMAGLEVEEIIRSGDELVFSTYVTPNRPDLLSVVGVAREASALLATPFSPPKPMIEEGEVRAADLVRVDIESPENCPRYSARVVLDVQIRPSPEWAQKRLIEAGLRPINNVVDATNYVLIELGQPLHAFDYDLVADHHIIVRQAKPGEKIVTIDGEERTLDESVLVIADADRAVAIAGVMGGSETEVNPSTRNVLLESAHFNPRSIRRTSKKLEMSTEASYRFERCVDPETTVLALDRVAQLIREWGGGVIAQGVVDEYPIRTEPMVIRVRPERASALLGVQTSAETIVDYFCRLGIMVHDGEDITVTVPTYRPDIQREIDLIEEVGRLYGYDAIPEKLAEGETMQGDDSPEGRFASFVSEVLVSCGLQEVVTHTLVSPMEWNGRQVALRNPISDDLSRLRNSLVPNLLSVIAYNAGRGLRDIGIFEVGRVFVEDEESVTERLSVAAAVTGSMWGPTWNVDRSSLDADFYLAKGIVESLLSRLGAGEAEYQPASVDGFHPTRAAFIQAGESRIGVIGEIGAELTRKFDLPGRTYTFELDFDELLNICRTGHAYKRLSRYPATTRDLAVVVADEVPYNKVRDLVVKGAGDLIESVSLFDLYRGAPLPVGQKSLAFTLVFRSPDRTLRDEEVDGRLESVRGLLVKELSASFR